MWEELEGESIIRPHLRAHTQRHLASPSAGMRECVVARRARTERALLLCPRSWCALSPSRLGRCCSHHAITPACFARTPFACASLWARSHFARAHTLLARRGHWATPSLCVCPPRHWCPQLLLTWMAMPARSLQSKCRPPPSALPARSPHILTCARGPLPLQINAVDNMDGEEFGDDNFDFDAEAEDEDRSGNIADTI